MLTVLCLGQRFQVFRSGFLRMPALDSVSHSTSRLQSFSQPKLVCTPPNHCLDDDGLRLADGSVLAARAALDGRDYVRPDDIKQLTHPVLGHRLLLSSNTRLRGRTADDVLDEILAEVRGLDLPTCLDKGTLSDAVVAEIRAAWMEHAVLVFPDQMLTDQQQVAFSMRFGPLEEDLIDPTTFVAPRPLKAASCGNGVIIGKICHETLCKVLRRTPGLLGIRPGRQYVPSCLPGRCCGLG
mgnify:CR=1 FL=1